MNLPRPEYPRPQCVRADWLCLNGEWQFEIDQSDSGLERGLLQRDLENRIQVPFCPESPLSGIGKRDFLQVVWYKRQVEVPAAWSNKRFAALCGTLLDNPHMFGYCYTQLTDVSIEQNGIYTFDRRPKFDLARLHAIQTRPAAIEAASSHTLL